MKQYLVFGWTEDSDPNSDPANEFLGTTSDLIETRPAGMVGTEQHFGMTCVTQTVMTIPNILQGKGREMLVFKSYDHIGGVDKARPFLAYMEIKD